MSQTKFLSPDEIKDYNTAFVQSLYQLNNLAHQQRMQILEEASFILREINRSTPQHLSESGEPLAEIESELTKKKESLKADTANRMPDAENSTDDDGDQFYDTMVKALGLAQLNAVNNQDQANMLAQASIAQGIKQIYGMEDTGKTNSIKENNEQTHPYSEQN